MGSALQQYAGDHRYLLELAARRAGFADPVAVDMDEFGEPLLKKARKRELAPIDDVLVRDWSPDNRRDRAGLRLGMRLYEIDGVRFVSVRFDYSHECISSGHEFFVVDRRDYRRLYRSARRCRRDSEPPCPPPVLHDSQAEILWKNTIGYLERENLNRIHAYGGKPRRGLVLSGSPGNGKTMACRWIWEACRRRNWEWRLITPDAYRAARAGDDPVKDVKELFNLDKRGVIFFDDMDLALRDRETSAETEDQSIFLTALDGIEIKKGIVYVFTTNCSLDLIDRAFKRPGRIDVVLRFLPPDAGLRRRLLETWHPDIQEGVDLAAAVASTDGYSFAEIDELKNLLILHYMDAQCWDWHWAIEQFARNRSELTRRRRHVGFHAHYDERNGSFSDAAVASDGNR